MGMMRMMIIRIRRVKDVDDNEWGDEGLVEGSMRRIRRRAMMRIMVSTSR